MLDAGKVAVHLPQISHASVVAAATAAVIGGFRLDAILDLTTGDDQITVGVFL